jgi:hypothetical protein
MAEIGVDAGEFRLVAQHAQQIGAHRHQPPGAAGSQIEAAEQLVPARLDDTKQRRQRLR